MNHNNIKEITQNLSSVNVLNDTRLDITWNYFNTSINSREILLFILTKTSLIPMIDYFAPISNNEPKKVYEEFGINLEQATNIQKLNIDLLNIQKLIQIYCSQTYTISSISNEMLYNLIDSIPEETNIEDIKKFMETTQLFKLNEQKGGNRIDTIKLFINFLLILLLCTPSISTYNELYNNLDLVTKKDNYSPQNVGTIVNKDDNEFRNIFKSLENIKTIVDVSKTISIYDKDIKNKYDNLIGSLLQLIIPPQDGKQFILDIIENFNRQSRNQTINIQKNCIKLMKGSFEHDIFAKWKYLDNVENTKQKINEAKELIKEQNESQKKVGASTVAAVTSFATGDIISGALYLTQAGESIWNSFSSTERIKEIKTQISTDDKEITAQLTPEQKVVNEYYMYKFSRYYCLYGYNLQLTYDDNSNIINVIGGKIDYNSIINFIITLRENLKLAIENCEKDPSKNVECLLLKSIEQRLNILSEITDEISYIVNDALETHIVDIQMQPSPNSINDIKVYFDEQLNKLNDLIIKLGEMYPKETEQRTKEKEQITEKLKATKETIELKVLEQNYLDLQTNATNIINQRSAERYAINMASSWTATETYIKSWVKLGKSGIELTGTSLGQLTKELSNALGEIPKGLIDSSLQLFNSILWKLLTNPSGWICLSLPLFMFFIYFGYTAGLIRTFTYGGKKVLTIVYGGFVFIYTLIKTPFGYLFKKENVLLQIEPQVKPQQISSINQPDELDDLSSSFSSLNISNRGRGGKRKILTNKKLKTKKYNKNKNLKTKKNNKNKTLRKKKSIKKYKKNHYTKRS